ncbi:MAG: hypothetical protein GHHEDOFH_03522 [Pseudorhodoplanes sp.]|nr:hypothetical protein [Pseudorhodoplanes sp.]GIK79183.1 MAG: hypothetical protein BroJett024_02880 [Alphaproteobacteria bacterium]
MPPAQDSAATDTGMFGGLVTVENLMYLAGGLLAAWLVALPVVPLVHERAIRLARRRYEALQRQPGRQMQQAILRAELATNTRRLERTIESMTDKASAHMREIADKRAILQTLKTELAEREAAIAALERRDAEPGTQLAAARAERDAARAETAATATVLRQAQDDIRALRAEIAALTEALEERVAPDNRQEYETTTPAARAQPVREKERTATPVGSAAAFAPRVTACGPDEDRHAIERAVQAILAEGAAASMTRH